MMPLQAADLLAYESYRYVLDVKLGGQPERWQWQKLRPLVARVHVSGEFDLLKLIEYIQNLAAGDATSSDAAD